MERGTVTGIDPEWTRTILRAFRAVAAEQNPEMPGGYQASVQLDRRYNRRRYIFGVDSPMFSGLVALYEPAVAGDEATGTLEFATWRSEEDARTSSTIHNALLQRLSEALPVLVKQTYMSRITRGFIPNVVQWREVISIQRDGFFEATYENVTPRKYYGKAVTAP